MTQTGAPSPTYSITHKTRFGPTDLDGIVWNYFDMFNGAVEGVFDECVGASFQRMSAEERVTQGRSHERQSSSKENGRSIIPPFPSHQKLVITSSHPLVRQHPRNPKAPSARG
jgi:hypothetical protein